MKKEYIQEIRDAIDTLNKWAYHYYVLDNPIVSDKEYDALYDKLTDLEVISGLVFSDSPTQRPGGAVLESLKKVTHESAMLSADKTKDINVLRSFLDKAPDKKGVLSWKEDGLTIVLTYEEGKLVSAVTRGDGTVGEDVTHTVKRYKNIPLQIETNQRIIVRGEGLVRTEDFEQFNLLHEENFSHPRNMAAASTRLLDSNVAAKRNLRFIAFELVSPQKDKKTEQFSFLENLGFDVVPYCTVIPETLEKAMKEYQPENYEFPVDGLVLEYEDSIFGRSLGATSHHRNNLIAFKWGDELHQTEFIGVERRTTRTGMVSLTARFKPVMIDGHKVQKATLHNLSFFENLKLGEGDKILVYKANMIIPEIHKNETQSGTYQLDMHCPCCNEPLEVRVGSQTGSKNLYCTNPNCNAKKAALFEHYCSKHAANIVGLSGAGLDDMLMEGYIHDLHDIYHLEQYRSEMEKMDGWGKSKVNNLLKSIDKSRKTTLGRLLTSLGIPMIGKNASRDIEKKFHGNPQEFLDAVTGNYDFHNISGFGDAMCNSLVSYFKNEQNIAEWNLLVSELEFEIVKDASKVDSPFTGKSVVATGSFQYFTRDSINAAIEKLGGMAKGSVSKSTDFVIAGEKAGSKKDKAISFGVPILSEEDLLAIIGVPEGAEREFLNKWL